MNIRNLLVLTLIAFSGIAVQAQQRRTENVILITLDGARTQEVFGGLDIELYKAIDEKAESRKTFQKFSANTAKKRREKLMPFFWNVLMKDHGSIAGNRKLKSTAQTTNKRLFSYPGYSEIMTGEAHDDVIKSNARVQNRFPSFLQFLQKKLKLNYNEVASFSSWSVMNEIVSSKADAFLINAGYEKYESNDSYAQWLSASQFETPTPWSSVRHDYYTFGLALAHAKKYRPRVLHIGLGETDDWAHNKRYDMVLDALNRTDRYLQELWKFVTTDKRYKGKTSIIITIDHGRGPSKDNWHGHGDDVPVSRNIWIAFISPDSELRGEWRNTGTVYQNQVAATLCSYLGFDYSEQHPNAGRPIKRVLPR